MPNRSTFRLIARTLLTLMLFAQAAMAWSACEWPQRAPERAVLAAADAMPCHDADYGAVCLAHCQSERQVVQKVSFVVHAMPAAPVLVLVQPVETEPDLDVSKSLFSTPGISPPRRILLQSLQL